MKTYVHTTAQLDRHWHVVDATDKVLGRLATEIAAHLIGKSKPTYQPNLDGGDFVVVINAEKITITGNKYVQKKYRRHSGYVGNLKEETFAEKFAKDPTEVVRLAVLNMLPKNKLRSNRMTRLKIYVGEDHPHAGQVTAPKDTTA